MQEFDKLFFRLSNLSGVRGTTVFVLQLFLEVHNIALSSFKKSYIKFLQI